MAEFKNEFTYRKFLEVGDEKGFDFLFDDAVNTVKKGLLGKRHPMHIGGKERYANEELREYSPIDHTLVGIFPKGTREHAFSAVQAAKKAFAEWSEADYRDRIAIIRDAAALFTKRKFEIAAIMSIENGKTRYESIGEVDEAIDFLNYYALDMERNKGYKTRALLGGTKAAVAAGFQGAPGREEAVTIAMKPYGVFGVIAPFNFPISISVGMSTGALITGNTVVFKPSSTDNMTMLTGLEIYKIFKDAKMPDGVFNYVTGPGSEVGDELLKNRDVSGIAFTGSRSTGMNMLAATYSAGNPKTFVVEMGGKNAAIVSKHANIEDAAAGIASAAFGYAGQKCSACSRAYVNEDVKEEFISRLVEITSGYRIGDPLLKENYVGPLISSGAFEKYNKAVAEAKKEGRIIYGGRIVSSEKGFYVEPMIAEIKHGSRLMHDELFLPFLSVDTYKDFHEAIAKANDTEYGLTGGLYSENRKEISEFMEKMQAGVLYVNRRTSATTGAIVGFHTFVGWKGSGLTGKGTGSRFYLQQFMREQSQAIVK